MQNIVNAMTILVSVLYIAHSSSDVASGNTDEVQQRVAADCRGSANIPGEPTQSRQPTTLLLSTECAAAACSVPDRAETGGVRWGQTAPTVDAGFPGAEHTPHGARTSLKLFKAGIVGMLSS